MSDCPTYEALMKQGQGMQQLQTLAPKCRHVRRSHVNLLKQTEERGVDCQYTGHVSTLLSNVCYKYLIYWKTVDYNYTYFYNNNFFVMVKCFEPTAVYWAGTRRDF